jgi:hypothetical protein
MPGFVGFRFAQCCRVVWAVGVVLLAATLSPALADRPSSMKLFPEGTLLFVRMANAKEFGEKLRDSSTGRMVRDPQMQPFFEDVYGKASELYSEHAEAFMGVSWEELQQLPEGEIAFAIVSRVGLTPAFLLLVDQGDEPSSASKLLERALEYAEQNGADFSSESIDGVEITVISDPEDDNRQFGVFERENSIVVATDVDVLRRVLWHWDNAGGVARVADAASEAPTKTAKEEGEESESEGDDAEGEDELEPGRTLAENIHFSSILRNCRRPQDPPPHAIFFIDPIGLFTEFSRGNAGAGLAAGFLPQIGLDGLLGAGGTLTFAVGPYDDLAHVHLLLENPRSGVLQLLTFESGDTTPQEFVPFATENYFTGHWNAKVFYDRLQGLVDKLLGEGTFNKQFEEKFADFMGVDIRTGVVDNLAGRVTLFSAYEKPAHFRSQKYTIAAELVDEEAGLATLKQILDKHQDQFEERQFGDVTYWAITPEWWRNMEESQRPFNAFVAIMDGHFFIGGSCQLFEQVIAARDGTIDRLADSDDYARIVATIGKETAGMTPSMFMVQRAEESMRHLYDLLTSEESRAFIDENAEENPVLAALAESLDAHQLPPFEALIQYFGPGGGIFYDTDNGYHGISFTLRNETAP